MRFGRPPCIIVPSGSRLNVSTVRSMTFHRRRTCLTICLPSRVSGRSADVPEDRAQNGGAQYGETGTGQERRRQPRQEQPVILSPSGRICQTVCLRQHPRLRHRPWHTRGSKTRPVHDTICRNGRRHVRDICHRSMPSLLVWRQPGHASRTMPHSPRLPAAGLVRLSASWRRAQMRERFAAKRRVLEVDAGFAQHQLEVLHPRRSLLAEVGEHADGVQRTLDTALRLALSRLR